MGMREMVKIGIVYILILIIIITHLSSIDLVYTLPPHSIDNMAETYAYVIEIEIGGSITNLGKEPVKVNETDLLVYDYPYNTSSQEVVYAELYYNNESIPYRVRESGDNYVLEPAINISDLIDVNDTAYSKVVYRVNVFIDKRRSEIADLSFDRAGSWDELPEDEELTNATGLWNYTNPLIRMFYKYIMRRKSSTPLHYLANLLDWVDSNVRYKTRVPPRHPWEVVLRRRGDCDDQANLIVTLLRAAGIPSFIETGMVYVSKDFRSSGEAGDGMLKYTFIGGGAHGWLVAYIPPWGYLRVDLTLARGKPGDLESMLNHIRNAAYYSYMFPTVVMGQVKKGDYAEEGTKFIESIKEEKLKYNIYVKVRKIS